MMKLRFAIVATALFLSGCGCAVKIGYTVPATFFVEFQSNVHPAPATQPAK